MESKRVTVTASTTECAENKYHLSPRDHCVRAFYRGAKEDNEKPHKPNAFSENL